MLLGTRDARVRTYGGFMREGIRLYHLQRGRAFVLFGAFLLTLFVSVGSAGALAADDAPIRVLKAEGGFADPSNGNYNLVCGVSFKNVSNQEVVAIKWHIKVEDAFHTVLDTETVDSYGTYSPGVVIEPKRTWGSGVLETDNSASDTNAWIIYNAYDKQVTTFIFVVAVVKFADGQVWMNPSESS